MNLQATVFIVTLVVLELLPCCNAWSKFYSRNLCLILTFGLNAPSANLAYNMKTYPMESVKPTTIHSSSNNKVCNIEMNELRLIGSGGSGDVYVKSSHDTVFKLSRNSNRKGVINECNILQYLAQYQIPHIESCVSCCEHQGKQLEVLKPFFAPAATPVSDFMLIQDEVTRTQAIYSYASVNLDILRAGVVLSDLQVLIDRDTGNCAITVARKLTLTNLCT